MTAEEAIKWIEEEVYENGVFRVELEKTEVMQRNKACEDQYGNITIHERVHSMEPTGDFKGFTCSSQHVTGHNFMQMIMAMKREAEQRECKHVWVEEPQFWRTSSKLFRCSVCDKTHIYNPPPVTSETK